MKKFYINDKKATVLICKSQAEAVECLVVLENSNFGKNMYISSRSKKWQYTWDSIKYYLIKAGLDHTFISKK